MGRLDLLSGTRKIRDLQETTQFTLDLLFVLVVLYLFLALEIMLNRKLQNRQNENGQHIVLLQMILMHVVVHEKD